MKGEIKERRKKERLLYHEIKTDVVKKECITVVVRDCITGSSKALNIVPTDEMIMNHELVMIQKWNGLI
jgi:hypothetical protein